MEDRSTGRPQSPATLVQQAHAEFGGPRGGPPALRMRLWPPAPVDPPGGAPVPEEVRELAEVCGGFELGGEYVGWAPEEGCVVYEGLFDTTVTVQEDGCGGGTFVDVDAESGEWGAVLRIDGGLPRIVLEAHDLAAWLSALFSRHRRVLAAVADRADAEQAYQDLAGVPLDPPGRRTPWVPVERLRSSDDPDLRAFTRSLPTDAWIADLRAAEPGDWLDLEHLVEPVHRPGAAPDGEVLDHGRQRRHGRRLLVATHHTTTGARPHRARTAASARSRTWAVGADDLDPAAAGELARAVVRAVGGERGDLDLVRSCHWGTHRVDAVAAMAPLLPPTIRFEAQVELPGVDPFLQVLPGPGPDADLEVEQRGDAPGVWLHLRGERLVVSVTPAHGGRAGPAVAWRHLRVVRDLERAGLVPVGTSRGRSRWFLDRKRGAPSLYSDGNPAAALWSAGGLRIGSPVVAHTGEAALAARLAGVGRLVQAHADWRVPWDGHDGPDLLPELDEDAVTRLLRAHASSGGTDPARFGWRSRTATARTADLHVVLRLNEEPQETGGLAHAPGRRLLLVGGAHSPAWDPTDVAAAVGRTLEPVPDRFRLEPDA